MPRDVMLVGSVPLRPAMSVFKCACANGLTSLLPRIPDGEQAGWVLPLLKLWEDHPALRRNGEAYEISRRATGVPFFNIPLPILELKPGHGADELMIEDMGVARGFESSYAEFKQAKADGVIAPQTRFVASITGPGTATMPLKVPHGQLFPVLSRIYRDEIARIVEIAPPHDLAVQIDLAWEITTEEYCRRPEAWDTPLVAFSQPQWPFEAATSLIAEIASAVPEPIELGLHLCSLYHIDESQGQDLNVHVDWSNALIDKVNRPIDYIHMPTTPDYDVRDFEPLRRLRSGERTKLFLGLIHAEDGIAGAARRIRAAAQIRPDFGVAAFCGLNVISQAQAREPIPIDVVFDLHRAAAHVA